MSSLGIPAIGLTGLQVVPYRGSPDDAPGTRIQNGGVGATPFGSDGGVGPGGVGNFIVTAHRTSSTRAFARLPELRPGHRVHVEVGGGKAGSATPTRSSAPAVRRSAPRPRSSASRPPSRVIPGGHPPARCSPCRPAPPPRTTPRATSGPTSSTTPSTGSTRSASSSPDVRYDTDFPRKAVTSRALQSTGSDGFPGDRVKPATSAQLSRSRTAFSRARCLVTGERCRVRIAGSMVVPLS